MMVTISSNSNTCGTCTNVKPRPITLPCYMMKLIVLVTEGYLLVQTWNPARNTYESSFIWFKIHLYPARQAYEMYFVSTLISRQLFVSFRKSKFECITKIFCVCFFLKVWNETLKSKNNCWNSNLNTYTIKTHISRNTEVAAKNVKKLSTHQNKFEYCFRVVSNIFTLYFRYTFIVCWHFKHKFYWLHLLTNIL